jgi:tetratricopeptide (TPR) repeat protein
LRACINAIALHPSAPKLYVGRGDAFNNLKKYDQGIADFDHALALDPKDDEALNDRATALVAKGQHAEAIRGFDAALELATSRRALVLGNRCHAKVMAGEVDGAFADCDASLRLEPGNADRLAGRGFINLKGERFAAAIADFDAALAVKSERPFCFMRSGRRVVAARANSCGPR